MVFEVLRPMRYVAGGILPLTCLLGSAEAWKADPEFFCNCFQSKLH